MDAEIPRVQNRSLPRSSADPFFAESVLKAAENAGTELLPEDLNQLKTWAEFIPVLRVAIARAKQG